MRNSDRYLVSFNAIEKALKVYVQNNNYISFTRLIQLAKRSNAVVRRYYEDLKEFAELRNAIVHDTIDIDYAIAEPHDEIVKKIEQIEQEIIQPKKVIPLFNRKVTTFQSENTLANILKTINRFSYSKFPIYQNGRFIGLLTKEGIVNWLATHVDDLDSLSFSKIQIKDMLVHQKKNKNYLFINRDTTIYEVKEIFKKYVERESARLDALLITEHGDKNEALLGIVTLEDLIKVP